MKVSLCATFKMHSVQRKNLKPIVASRCMWHSSFIRLCGCIRYLGPISTSFSSLPSVRFGFSDSGSACRGGRNNQRRTSFCSAPRLSQPAAESGKKQWQCVTEKKRKKKTEGVWENLHKVNLCVSQSSLFLRCLQPPASSSDKLFHTHLSAPHCSTAPTRSTAGGRAWLLSVRLSHSPLHYCRTSLQPWLTERQRNKSLK